MLGALYLRGIMNINLFHYLYSFINEPHSQLKSSNFKTQRNYKKVKVFPFTANLNFSTFYTNHSQIIINIRGSFGYSWPSISLKTI